MSASSKRTRQDGPSSSSGIQIGRRRKYRRLDGICVLLLEYIGWVSVSGMETDCLLRRLQICLCFVPYPSSSSVSVGGVVFSTIGFVWGIWKSEKTRTQTTMP